MAEIVVKLVDGQLAGKTAQSITKEINAAALATKKAEIGTKEWVAAHAKLENAKKLQADLKTQIDSTSKASNVLKSNFGGVLNQIPGFSKLSGMFGMLKGGVGGLTSASQLLKVAMMAIPIFLLIGAITTLVGWFTKTEKGANMLLGAFKGMGAALDTLLSKLWNIKETFKELLANPMAFFKNLGKDMASAAKEGYNLVQVFDDIEDRQRDLQVKAKEQDILVDKLLLSAKNVGKTYEEKLAILSKSDKATRDSYKEQLSLSKEYLDAVDREIEAAKKNGTFGDELADKQKDAKLAYLDLVAQETQVEEKIANFRDKIFDKQEKALEKSNDQKKKALDKEAKDLEESLKKLEDLRVQAIKDAETEELAAAELKFQRELESITLQGEQQLEAEKLIEEVKAQELQAIRDKYAQQKVAAEKKAADEKAAADKEASDEAKRIAKEEADFKNALTEAQLGFQSQAIGAVVSLLGEDEKARKKNAQAIKAFTIAQIITDTEREIAGYMANPASTATLGAVGTFKTIGALIRAGLAIRKVSKQQFAGGGYTGDGGKYQPAGVVHAGEVVWSQEDVKRFGGVRAVESIRPTSMRGSYAVGGPVNPFDNSRGPIASGASSSPGSSSNFNDLKNTFVAYAEAMDKRIDRIQVNNNVQDTQDQINLVNGIRDEADV